MNSDRTRKPGKRHTLLIYQRVMDRLWASTLALGLLLLGLRATSWFAKINLLEPRTHNWVLAGAITALAFSLFAFLARKMAYVQAHRDHVRLSTPFLSLRISYRRIRSAHPAEFNGLFPPKDARWAERRLLEPFYGMTVVFLELNQYPLSPAVLRLFLAPQMFSRQKKGFILLVADWMALSTELDSSFGAWMQAQSRQRAAAGQMR